jgi:hypothetical protein
LTFLPSSWLDVLNAIRRLINSEGRAPRDPNISDKSGNMGRCGTPPSDIFTTVVFGVCRDLVLQKGTKETKVVNDFHDFVGL